MSEHTKDIYLDALNELQKVISNGDINRLGKLNKVIASITHQEDIFALNSYFNESRLKNTNVVILACKYAKIDILERIFDTNCSIIRNLSTAIGKDRIRPIDEDSAGLNAFYYAIRSGNVSLLETLIYNWPGDFFNSSPPRVLDEVLSKAYEEIKLKNIEISLRMQFFVESKLIDLRFFSETQKREDCFNPDNSDIRERVRFLHQNIIKLIDEYTDSKKKVDSNFLFVAKFIAQNIHIVKRFVKATYSKLPWEEIEFCLICFVSSHVKRQEMNIFYRFRLDKERLLTHLTNFAGALRDVIVTTNFDAKRINNIPNVKRDEVVSDITRIYPKFKDLYNDYKDMRDIHSLRKINDLIMLASKVDPKEKNNRLVIVRVLQVIGEFSKNTLLTPKLSADTSNLLLMQLPKNTRKMIIELRNSFSHAHSLSNRMEIEANTDIEFFTGIQSDIRKIGATINTILLDKKRETITKILQRIIDCENVCEMKDISDIFVNTDFTDFSLGTIESDKAKQLKKRIEKLQKSITDPTDLEKKLFNEIYPLLSSEENIYENSEFNYLLRISCLKSLKYVLSSAMDHNAVRITKYFARKEMEKYTSDIESNKLKEIFCIIGRIYFSIQLRSGNIDELSILFLEIANICKPENEDITWIEELREKINQINEPPSPNDESKILSTARKRFDYHLSSRLSELKDLMNKMQLGQSFEEFLCFKSDKKLQAVIEMLLIDILSILGDSSDILENNILFWDEHSPLLNGKCLRNHLAHDNTLVELLYSDPSVSIIANSKNIIEKNILRSSVKIGKLTHINFTDVKDNYYANLEIVNNQESMFTALEEGNVKAFKESIAKGADVNAYSINRETAMHVAARGHSLELVKFLVKEGIDPNGKNADENTPLHISSAYGREELVQFFIKEAKTSVDCLNFVSQTPLHFASENGHKNVILYLLRNGACFIAQDAVGHICIDYAIRNRHEQVAKILLEWQMNNNIEHDGQYSSLHQSSEYGVTEVVKYLVKHDADVNAPCETNYTSLHAASLNGHLEIVNILIDKGAVVNAKQCNGCTPLHYAVESGYELVAEVLVKNGANVNAADYTFYNTPLHYASKDGHKGIVEMLLRNKANCNAATVAGLTPLHFAAMNGHLEIVNTLLTYGAKITAKDKENSSPLHYAASSAHRNIVQLLMGNRADVNSRNYMGLTPLHNAALKCGFNLADYIQFKGRVDIQHTCRSEESNSSSVKGDNLGVIDVLLKNGAKINAKTTDGFTPLYLAALSSHLDAVLLLIKMGADIHAKDNQDSTLLSAAVLGGDEDIVKCMLRAEVNVNVSEDCKVLCSAVEARHKKIVEILLSKGNIDHLKENLQMALHSAISNKDKEIVNILLENGAYIDMKCLELAVIGGSVDILHILLNICDNINGRYEGNNTLLHLAASRGHQGIVKNLLTSGAEVDPLNNEKQTPLILALLAGHEKVAQILIANKANVNVFTSSTGAPLHLATILGFEKIVESLIINGVQINVIDYKNRTPFELAVAYGHLVIVKMLFECGEVDINKKGNLEFTVLHIAAQEKSLEIVKFLVDQGSDVHAKNESGSKPIHIAVREGRREMVEFFLSKGLSIHEPGCSNQTLLHYATIRGSTDMLEYLIERGADVNMKDKNGSTPVHIASVLGYINVIEVLLRNGAAYDAVNYSHASPFDIARDVAVIKLLGSTKKLFEAVKQNQILETGELIEGGAFVNAKNVSGFTPLHFAAWKGHVQIVKKLLENNANPNLTDNKKTTALHYAAKFSHVDVVKTILSFGGIYTPLSDSNKTPLNYASDSAIIKLFNVIDQAFHDIQHCDSKVLKNLNKIKNFDMIKAIMSARNAENKNLVTIATITDFPQTEQLKNIFQDKDIPSLIHKASVAVMQGKTQTGLRIYRDLYEKRKEILGSDNPGTWDIQKKLSEVLYAEGKYDQLLELLNEVFEKQKEVLGFKNRDTLSIGSRLAFAFHKKEQNVEAVALFEDIYSGQRELLGVNHSDTLETLLHMALALEKLKEYERANEINRLVFKMHAETLGEFHPFTIHAENNIGMVLCSQGKHEEGLKIYMKVLEKKKLILGIENVSTLRTLHSIANLKLIQKKYYEAMKGHEEVYNLRKTFLGESHPDTLTSQVAIAETFFNQKKFIKALKVYREILRKNNVFGPGSSIILNIQQKIQLIHFVLKAKDVQEYEIENYLHKQIMEASGNGDVKAVRSLIDEGADVNAKDADGRTPLHYAVGNGHRNIVAILLKNGADVTRITTKGNTPIHTAAVKGYARHVEILLENVNCAKLPDLINARTLASGSTALHVASKNGHYETSKVLLKFGAIFDIANNDRKTPVQLTEDQTTKRLLNLIKELFEDAKKGNFEIITKMKTMMPEELSVVTNARNSQMYTILQVVLNNKHFLLAKELSKMLKRNSGQYRKNF